MQGKGADIDIVTGRPVEMREKETAEDKRIREEERLRTQAEFLGVAHTEAGQKLVALVASRLQDRIEQLVAADPEASAYAAILNEMGNRERRARTAVERITAERLGLKKQ